MPAPKFQYLHLPLEQAGLLPFWPFSAEPALIMRVWPLLSRMILIALSSSLATIEALDAALAIASVETLAFEEHVFGITC